mmetsp:Transcript_35464/g.111608  ORF Transcript_35464/g.111608 Transcript_35464/m.111608 type:complete len:209 (-) Transcript_35464:77-703(-)
MRPMPTWMVAPSSTSAAMFAPMSWWICCSSAPPACATLSSHLKAQSMKLAWTRLSPCVRGTLGFTCAMITCAISQAATATSTLVPMEQYPCLSGGLTWMNATSIGMISRRKKLGISLRKHGVASARPSATACRMLDPRKSPLHRKDPSMPGSTRGLWPSVWMECTATSESSGARPASAFTRCLGVIAAPCTKTLSPLLTLPTASSAVT